MCVGVNNKVVVVVVVVGVFHKSQNVAHYFLALYCASLCVGVQIVTRSINYCCSCDQHLFQREALPYFEYIDTLKSLPHSSFTTTTRSSNTYIALLGW